MANTVSAESRDTGGGEGLAVCLQGIRRMLWAERTPASDGLHTGAGPRVMDGCGQGCLEAVCESFTILSCFHPKPALCITQESAPIALPDREGGERAELRKLFF